MTRTIKEVDAYFKVLERLKVVYEEVKLEFKKAYGVKYGLDTTKCEVWVTWEDYRLTISLVQGSFCIGEQGRCFKYYGDDKLFKKDCVEKFIWEEDLRDFVDKLEICVKRAQIPSSIRFIQSLAVENGIR